MMKTIKKTVEVSLKHLAAKGFILAFFVFNGLGVVQAQSTSAVARDNSLVTVKAVKSTSHSKSARFAQFSNYGFNQDLTTEVQAQLAKNKFYLNLNQKDQDGIYLGFLKYVQNMKLNLNEPLQKQAIKNLISRLQDSSTQFLICDDINDWECIEKKPVLSPKSDYRQDVQDDLGKPVFAGDSLDIQAYFTTTWFEYQNQKNLITTTGSQREKDKQALRDYYKEQMRGSRNTVAKELAAKINNFSDKNLWMAMYGIDDIEDSMKPVYDAITHRIESNKPTYAVIDVANEGQPNQFIRDFDVSIKPVSAVVSTSEMMVAVSSTDETSFGESDIGKSFQISHMRLAKDVIDYSYIKPSNIDYWAFGRAPWQDELLNLGQKILSDYQDRKVKNPKLAPLRADDVESVFFSKKTGITKDIVWNMGLIRQYLPVVQDSVRIGFQYDGSIDLIRMLNSGINSNQNSRARIEWPTQGIMHNKFMVMQDDLNNLYVWSGTANIAQTCMGFENNSNMSVFINNNVIAHTYLDEFNEMFQADGIKRNEKNLYTGLFHKTKKPNTHRYFKFTDGTEVKVHFSPTDDGEHRAIIPFLLSAQSGDIIRISMFGGAGLETVRAMQLAAAKGVKVKVIMDATTSAGASMWPKNPLANLLEPNPYIVDPVVQSQMQNQIEVRYSAWEGLNHHKTATLTRNGKTISLIVGSQNWSESGNDSNDENMMTIRNFKNSILVGDQFNFEFDNKMWVLSTDARTTGALPPDDVVLSNPNEQN